MANNTIDWFEIYVQDMVRARAFYEAVFQVKLTDLGNPGLEMWAFPGSQDSAGVSGALAHHPQKPAGANSTVVYFHCQDCAEEAARVVPAGGTLVREKMSIGPFGFVVLAMDTEGNMIGLHSQV